MKKLVLAAFAALTLAVAVAPIASAKQSAADINANRNVAADTGWGAGG